jgi:hypothetical protein
LSSSDAIVTAKSNGDPAIVIVVASKLKTTVSTTMFMVGELIITAKDISGCVDCSILLKTGAAQFTQTPRGASWFLAFTCLLSQP